MFGRLLLTGSSCSRQAAADTQPLGQFLGAVAQCLQQRLRAAGQAATPGGGGVRLHGVGHGLGAHALGQAGRRSGGAFSRITGMGGIPVGRALERSEESFSQGQGCRWWRHVKEGSK